MCPLHLFDHPFPLCYSYMKRWNWMIKTMTPPNLFSGKIVSRSLTIQKTIQNATGRESWEIYINRSFNFLCSVMALTDQPGRPSSCLVSSLHFIVAKTHQTGGPWPDCKPQPKHSRSYRTFWSTVHKTKTNSTKTNILSRNLILYFYGW